jgi:hypothetical protein
MLVAKFIAVAFSPTRSPGLRSALCLPLAAILFSGCSPKASQSLFVGTAAQEAVKKLSSKIGSPARVLSIEIKPATLTMQVQDPAAPSQVNEYTYRVLAGLSALVGPSIAGPKPVRLNLINPNLEENLFDLTQVNFAAVAETVREAARRVALDGGGVAKTVHIQRRVGILPPSSGDVEWVIFVGGPRESASAHANAQGQIRRLDLGGTRRAQTLDYTKDSQTLLETIAGIRDQFGSEPIFNHFRVTRLGVAFSVRDSKDSNEIHEYNCDLNGVRRSFDAATIFKIPRSTDEKREFFSIDDTDWSLVPAMCKTAREKITLPHPNIHSIELVKPPPKLKPQPLKWRAQVIEGAMGEYGFVEFDPKTGQVTRVEPPRSQEKKVDFVELAKTQEFLANVKEDFGPAGQFLEITILHDSAVVKALAPGKRDEIQKYTYDARERARPQSSGFPKSPFDSFEEKDLFGIAELESFEARIPELEKKTIERLRITDGTIRHLKFYRRSPIYPGNKKLLLEIWCEGKGDGRIVYDPAGNEFDLVGGNPSGPVRPTGPQMKSGIFTGEDERFTSSPDSAGASDEKVNALFDQWQAVLDADGVAEEKCNATRWGQLAEKGPVSPADLSLADYREYRLAELGRIASAKKVLAFLERPGTKTLMPQLMTTTERHGFDHLKFFDLQFWRATIRRMVASNELKKLTEEHWEEFQHGAFPKEGPNLKAWQRKYLRVEAEEKAAREERQRIIAKYQGESK